MKNLIRAYLLISILEGMVALRSLFLIPSMERNAWMMGFSFSRMLLGAAMLALLGLLLWLLVRSFCSQKWQENAVRLVQESASHGRLVILVAAILWLGMALAVASYLLSGMTLLYDWLNMSNLQAALARLLPLLTWMLLLALQAALALLAIHYITWVRLAGNAQNTDDEAAPIARFSLAEQAALATTGLLAAALLYLGWRAFWFLTDDAHIAFRYVSNSMLGYGLVWNLPPFRPVEGYTSYLWVILLGTLWRLFGIEPPAIANLISLAFSALSLLAMGLMFFRLRLSPHLRSFRVPLFALVLSGVLSNRTFLAWTSSGLETAMFNFFLIAWICCMVFLPVYSRRWLASNAALALLCYLTRPDGILMVTAMAALTGMAFYAKMQQKQFSVWDILSATPLLGFPIHMLWRHAFYGEWLPNTHFAKTIPGRYWMEAGSRYLLSFVIEYFLWLWLLVLFILLVKGLRQFGLQSFKKLWHGIGFRQVLLSPGQPLATLGTDSVSGLSLGRVLAAALALGVLITLALLLAGKWGLGVWALGTLGLGVLLYVALGLSVVEATVALTIWVHLSYYTLRIGGDFFEFRVYSYLVPLLFLSFVWMLNRLRLRAVTVALLLSAFIAFSLFIPWLHWAASQARITRQETYIMKVSVSDAAALAWPEIPAALTAYLQWYDHIQFYLIEHFICMRHQEHKIFYEFMINSLPSREVGLALPDGDYPVLETYSVGVTSWMLPRVNILDGFGLNDYVIARNPELGPQTSMAHERRAPQGYVECFMPNVILEGRGIAIAARKVALTAETIVACERDFAARMQAASRIQDSKFTVE